VLMDLDRRWKRWFCLTIVGIVLLMARVLRPQDSPQPNAGFVPPESFVTALKREKRVHLAFILVFLAALFLWPGAVLKGYLLPILLFGPFVLMMRFIFQHGETDPANPFHVAVYYRPSRLVRLLTYSAIGDGHMAHHFFPLIPFYRLGRAADLFHPAVSQHDVPQRSWWGTLYGFFVEGHAMRTRWPEAGPAASGPSASLSDPAGEGGRG